MTKKIKIYDCSNSSDRPPHRGYGGAVENACVSMLKQNAYKFGFEFVSDPNKADVLFTNDVYPQSLLYLNKPRVKRMDGIYWQSDLKERNGKLSAAALLSDMVIFISGFSQKSYFNMCGPLQCSKVVLNAVDNNVFYRITPKIIKQKPEVWAAAATHWERPEKRLKNICQFAEIIQKDRAMLYLVGAVPSDIELPFNVIPLGYLSPMDWNFVLNLSDAFINLSYRDAAPKVVLEACRCELPILLANSGGVPELCDGIEIDDPASDWYEDSVPQLDKSKISDGYRLMLENFTNTAKVDQNTDQKMLTGYFDTFRELV
jgi:glycosyltransferase involved in cell wall biosynthesis